MHSFDALTLYFWKVVQHISPLNNHYWHFLIPPSGPTSGSKGYWKMESSGPGMHSSVVFRESVRKNAMGQK